MGKKYRTEPDLETGLLRIIALKDFSDVKKGQLGGLIEKEDNLSQEGDCWVYDNARVCDNAQVFGDAKVYEKAKVYEDACVRENAKVYDKAKIYGNTQICGNAKIYENALVFGAWVGKNARVSGNIKLWSTNKSSIASSIKNSKDYVIYVIKRDFYIIVLSDIYGVSEGNYIKNIQTIRQLYGKEI